MQYSKFRPAEPSVQDEPKPRSRETVLPGLAVGFALTAALLVLLLLTQSRLSELSFQVTELERQLEALEIENEKLLVAHAQAYELERIEQAALELGMIHPAPHQFIDINIEP